jgi:signal transduction histidine kinase
MRILEYLDTRSRTFVSTLGFALVGLVGLLDYLTGPELSFSIFYLIPVSMVAWFADRRVGILASTASVLAWLAADLWSGRIYSSAAVPYWNAVVRYGLFLIVTFTLSSLHAARARQEEMGHFIVHDLRSPLSLVLSSLQFVRDSTGEITTEEARNLVAMCIASCNRMMSLINSLLDLARLESGKMPLQMREVATRELLEDATQQVSVLSGRGSVSLAVRVGEEDSAVLADYDVSVRILVNLLSNAVKFSPTNSTVTAGAERHGSDMIAFTVTDQGGGIPEEWQDKVFDKFSQVDVHRAGIATGSGLGLAFSRLAVEVQGGRIWLESEVGAGTTISFTLPAAPASRVHVSTRSDQPDLG